MLSRPTQAMRSWDEIAPFVDFAITNLLQEEPSLVAHRYHEQAVTHRLAFYLEQLFDGWHVDCEYNKAGEPDSKGIPAKKLIDGGHEIRPDIIIHQRQQTTPEGNLLVIEVKQNRRGRNGALKKLRCLVSDGSANVGYQFALYLQFSKSGIAEARLFRREDNSGRDITDYFQHT